MTNALAPAEVTAWGWRVPFLLGMLIVPVGLWLRNALEETHANEDDERTRSVSSLRVALGRFPGRILAGVCLVIGGALSDRVGRKPVTFVSCLLVLLLIYPAFLYLNASPTLATLLAIVAGLAVLNATGGATVIKTPWPRSSRSRCVPPACRWSMRWAWRSSAASASSS